MNNVITPIVNAISQEISDIKAGQFNFEHLISMIKVAVETAETNVQLTGEQKKDAVLSAITQVITQIHANGIIPDQYFTDISIAITTLGPVVINLICMASKGLIKINQEIKQKCKNCVIN